MATLKPSYLPTYDLYLRRQKLLRSYPIARLALPTQFPAKVESLSVWSGKDLDLSKFTYTLTLQDIEEIKAALEYFKDQKLPLGDLSPSTFKLPTLSQRLRHAATEVNRDSGIFVIRGMQPNEYSLSDNVIIHAGISSYIGRVRGSQSGAMDQIMHICNREDSSVTDLKSSSTSSPLPFHTDDTDILAFYALEAAGTGGDMLWASQGQIYNELAANRAEVLGTLADRRWPLQTSSEPPSSVNVSLLHRDRQGPFFWLARGNFTGTARTARPPELPGVTEQQADALDAVHWAAMKHAIAVPPQKGCFYFVNNTKVVHGRTAFKDAATVGDANPTEKRRHLLRLWIQDPTYARTMDGLLKTRWEQVFDKDNAKDGRWLLDRDMKPEMVSERLFRESFPTETVNSCQNS